MQMRMTRNIVAVKGYAGRGGGAGARGGKAVRRR